jgi:aromatic ring-opening dioxygenase catalytic subunit (LigB family)
MQKKEKYQIVYLSHGGGPLPILGDPSHKAMIEFMKNLPQLLIKPELIVVISAHWEEDVPTIIGGSEPELFYDYYGFPQQAYELKYPARGSSESAKKVLNMLEENGIEGQIDLERGFDHGMFIPLKLMYPNADIPCIQISLIKGLDAPSHIKMGKALRKILNGKTLIIGSGFSYHNIMAFFEQRENSTDTRNDEFQEWLIETITGKISQDEREDRLINWDKAPNARYCHPREEHLLPLHVCAGLAGKKGDIVFDDEILRKRGIAVAW